MLVSISRLTTKRLASTAFATSAARSVLSRATAKSQLQASIYGHYATPVRRLATARVAKKTSASKVAKKTTAKKPAAKKTTAKKTAAKKTTAKKTTAKKPVKKSTKTTAKAKPKAKSQVKSKRGRKAVIITPEKKAIRERQKLRATALFTRPKYSASTPWQLFMVEQTRGGGAAVAKTPALSLEFKQLPPAEIQRLETKSKENRVLNEAAYKAWVESHTPQQIYDANNARRLLKKKYNIPKGKLQLIQDTRLPKRPVGAFLLFSKSRWESGDFPTGMPLTESAAKITAEWKELSAADRQAYMDDARSQIEKYSAAKAAVLGHD
ncbi:hypothetical protein F4861DRAFT_523838 [Xylaria intraflava]|nr:hypothetical protein F4861DRAFT_523838 [Xylaria intraflava]